MQILERIWTAVTHVVSWLTLSPINGLETHQNPFVDKFDVGHRSSQSSIPTVTGPTTPGPTFKPPTGRFGDLPGSKFQCEYPEMVGYEPCSNERDRACWLRSTTDFFEYNIYTDYESVVPIGIDRYYVLRAVDYSINADGISAEHGKAFQLVHADGRTDEPVFPGPWIQACWGDRLHITIENKLADNGTSIHWHGIRQLHSMPMDGVNGVTQCPIRPNDRFEYVFNVTQYGSSWYHSHFSVQYADGLQGPITLHGPSSASYDEALYPTIMTDWGHHSAFYAITHNRDLGSPSILLNGTGDVRNFGTYDRRTKEFTPYQNTTTVKPKYHLNFDGPVNGVPKRYLLRLINTSFYTMLTFSIDGHLLQVITADFVPIVPYHTRAVNVAIGQRYNIIIEADQYGNAETSFWIRTWKTPCGDGVQTPPVSPWNVTYAQTGIVRYNKSSTDDPRSSPWPDELACVNEPYGSLVPILPWCVGGAANGDGKGEEMAVSLGQGENNYELAEFSLTKMYPDASNPYYFQINYSYPVFLNMWTDGPWRGQEVVIPENSTENDWAYLVLANGQPAIQHPIHLHGHDFAILHVSADNTPFDPSEFTLSCLENGNLKCNNPPRRDVVVLPKMGFMVIAFKTDNPGSWLMHCHIAFHASGGLALQILERLSDANEMWPTDSPDWQNAKDICSRWREYWGQNGMDDSGI